MSRHSYKVSICFVLCCTIILMSGCILKPLNRSNTSIASSKIAQAPSTAGTVQAIKNKLVLTPANLHFVNGVGHEFEDALMYEAYKVLFTADYQAGNFIGDLRNIFKKNGKVDKEVAKQLRKMAIEIYMKYVKPDYSVEWTVTPYVVGADAKQSDGITNSIPILDELPDKPEPAGLSIPQSPALTKWIGFIDSPDAQPHWENSTTQYVPFLNCSSKEEFNKTTYDIMKSEFGYYDVCYQAAFASKYIFCDFPYEIVKTPYYMVIPAKWSNLTSIRRFLPHIDKKDPIYYVHVAYLCDGTDLGKMPLKRVILSCDQGIGFSVAVNLKRHSRINEALDKIKDKINSYNLVTAALSAEYGEAGRKVGSVIDAKLHSAIVDMIKKEYYSDETVFTGICSCEGKDFDSAHNTITFKTKNYPSVSTDANKELSAFYKSNGYGAMAHNEFFFELTVDTVAE